MAYVPDNYDAWVAHEAEQERRLAELPVCCCCNEPIQQDEVVCINDEWICDECLDTYFRKDVREYTR